MKRFLKADFRKKRSSTDRLKRSSSDTQKIFSAEPGLEDLKLSDKVSQSSSTWFDDNFSDYKLNPKTKLISKNRSTDALDSISKKSPKSSLQASPLNSSTPHLSSTERSPIYKPKFNTPPESPQSNKFVKLRSKGSSNSQFLRRAEKASSVYGDKAQIAQKQRPRSSFFSNSVIMRRPRNSLNNTSLSLLNILDNKKMKASFLEFLESEYSSENLLFWLACESFRKLKNEEQRFREAQEIYEKYVSPTAPHQVNIDHIMRRQITLALTNDELVTTDIFDSAKRYVFSIMENDSFPRFLTSPYYKDALSGRKSPFEAVISNLLPASFGSNKTQTKIPAKNTSNNNNIPKIDLIYVGDVCEKSDAKLLKKNQSKASKLSLESTSSSENIAKIEIELA